MQPQSCRDAAELNQIPSLSGLRSPKCRSRSRRCCRLIWMLILALPDLAAQQRLEASSAPARPRVAVVLSGGGARGGAHIGVLRELERAGVPMDLIVGSSFGALIGGLYCSGYSTEDLELLIRSMDWNLLLSNASKRKFLDFNRKVSDNRKLVQFYSNKIGVKLPIGLQAGQKVQQLLDRLTAQAGFEAGNDFDKLPIAFRAVATDILSGKPHVFRSGSLGAAIRASSAVPGLFAPVEIEDTLLIDGGVADNLPTDIARASGADLVIAVDVSTPLKSRKEHFDSLIDVLNQVISFQIEESSRLRRNDADLLIVPQLPPVEPADFAKSHLLVENGALAARQALSRIEQLLQSKGLPKTGLPGRPRLLDPAGFDLENPKLPARLIPVREVRIERVEKVPRAFVEAEVSARPGGTITVKSLDDDASNLYATELFASALYRLESRNGGADVTYQVAERPPVKIGVGFRYDQDYDLTAMFELINRSAIGSSDIFFRALAGDAKQFELGMVHPYLESRRALISPQIHYYSQQRLLFNGKDRTSDYQDQRYGLGLSFQYLPTKAARISSAYTFDRVDIDRGNPFLSQVSPRNLAGLSSAIELDTLDDDDLPGRGLFANAGADWYERSMGGDFSFQRCRASMRQYFTFADRETFEISANWGRIWGAAPFYERLYAGGLHNLNFSSDRFIGLRRDEIAAREIGILGASVRHRLRRFRSGITKGIYVSGSYNAGFFDPGFAGRHFGAPVHGFGIGLHVDARFIGPLRFEIAGTNRRNVKVHIALGHRF